MLRGVNKIKFLGVFKVKRLYNVILWYAANVYTVSDLSLISINTV